MRGAQHGLVLQLTISSKDMTMKRIVAAVSFAVLAAPVFAAEISAPFEQDQLDRVVPNVEARTGNASVGSTDKTDVWAQHYDFIAPAQ
jgi:hypothetical protein